MGGAAHCECVLRHVCVCVLHHIHHGLRLVVIGEARNACWHSQFCCVAVYTDASRGKVRRGGVIGALRMKEHLFITYTIKIKLLYGGCSVSVEAVCAHGMRGKSDCGWRGGFL